MSSSNDSDNNSAPRALSIAGSDPSGGAGLQADLKTFSLFEVYGMTAVTCLTAGNTQGVTDVAALDPAFVRKQIQSVMQDIPPYAIKTGMLFNKEIILTIADELETVSCPVIVDPVMVTKRGDILLNEKERAFYRSHLLPLANVVTPNIPEAEFLAEQSIDTITGMENAAQRIFDLGYGSVLIKGGHLDDWDYSNDLLYDGHEIVWLTSERIKTKHTHGAGDAFSAAITALLARGEKLPTAAKKAKKFITKSILTAPKLGKGHGPVNLQER